MNLLFDLDGTLTDPKEGITASIRFAMQGLGMPLGAEVDLDWCIGPPLQQSFAKLLGLPERSAEALALYRQRFGTVGKFENKVYPGIEDALRQLSQRASLYVATSKPSLYAAQIIQHFGLAHYFKQVHGSEMDGRNTDKAELIASIMAQHALDPATTLMIGDREHDIIGARKNGLRGIGVLWGYGSREELMGAGADLMIEAPLFLPLALALHVV
jgi:phosphoglycolate phosphatase